MELQTFTSIKRLGVLDMKSRGHVLVPMYYMDAYKREVVEAYISLPIQVPLGCLMSCLPKKQMSKVPKP